jgi:predicted nucleic acid-binding protein
VTFLLDTNVLSELRKGQRANERVLEFAAEVGWASIHTSWVVIAELRRGAMLIRRRDASQARALDAWIGWVMETLEERVHAVDRSVAEAWASLMVPDPRSPLDALIAATALSREFTLVTRNTRDFTGCGLNLLDPWAFVP